MVNPRPVLITGASGAGKTTLACHLSEVLEYDHINVGDELALVLHQHGLDVQSRSEIGPLFMSTFGTARYQEVLEAIFRPSVVLDGVRLLSGVRHLRTTHGRSAFLHVFKSSRSSEEPTRDATVAAMRAEADLVVPWRADVTLLRRDADAVAKRLAPVSGHGTAAEP